MKTWGKYKRVSINNIIVGDMVAICSTDEGIFKPNKETLIKIDKERLNLLKAHKRLNFVFKSIADMVRFINDENVLRHRIKKYML